MEYSKKEFGMVAAIISDTILKDLYEVSQDVDVYFVGCSELCAKWSQEFIEANKDTDWEALQFDKATKEPLSKYWKDTHGDKVEEWDSGVIDFAWHKFETFKKEHGIVDNAEILDAQDVIAHALNCYLEDCTSTDEEEQERVKKAWATLTQN